MKYWEAFKWNALKNAVRSVLITGVAGLMCVFALLMGGKLGDTGIPSVNTGDMLILVVVSVFITCFVGLTFFAKGKDRQGQSDSD